MTLRIVSYNMLKGRSFFRKKEIQKDMAKALRKLDPDILLLQEFPDASLYDSNEEYPLSIFTDNILKFSAYGFNATTKRGQHGNAIISRFPILSSENFDISRTKWAKRGVLNCTIDLKNSMGHLHILCTHLDLFQGARNKQIDDLAAMISTHCPKNDPVVFSGDFNDWNKKLDLKLRQSFKDHDINFDQTPDPIKTWPAKLPLLPLDRIYVRGIEIKKLWTPTEKIWNRLSDHRPLIADCSFPIEKANK